MNILDFSVIHIFRKAPHTERSTGLRSGLFNFKFYKLWYVVVQVSDHMT